YKLHMIFLRRTPEFDRWLKGLRDTKAKAKIPVRLDRLSLGNAGDVAPVGEDVSEMRKGGFHRYGCASRGGRYHARSWLPWQRQRSEHRTSEHCRRALQGKQ